MFFIFSFFLSCFKRFSYPVILCNFPDLGEMKLVEGWKTRSIRSGLDQGNLYKYNRILIFVNFFSDFLEKKPVQEWDVGEVGLWLETIGCSEYKETFKQHDITGPELIKLERHDLNVSSHLFLFSCFTRFLFYLVKQAHDAIT